MVWQGVVLDSFVEYFVVFLGYLYVHALILGYHILVDLDSQMLVLQWEMVVLVLISRAMVSSSAMVHF